MSTCLRVKSQCDTTVNDKLKMAITSKHEIWLLNLSDTDEITVSAGELCGFNQGSFNDVAAGPSLKHAVGKSVISD